MMPSTIRSKNRLLLALSILFWLGVWNLASMALGREILLPSPLNAARALLALLGQERFWRTVLFSFSRIASGFGLALGFGIALAAAASRFGAVRILLAPPVALMHATPVASFIILVLLWVDSANSSFPVSFLMVFPVLYTSALSGLDAADRKLLEMARVFRVPLWRRAFYIYLPGALPFFLSGCRVALGLSWKSGVAAEVISQSAVTIGGSLYLSKLYLETPALFAWTAVIIVVSRLFETLCLSALSALGHRMERGAGL